MARQGARVLPFPVMPKLVPTQGDLFDPAYLYTPDNLVLRLTAALMRVTKLAPLVSHSTHLSCAFAHVEFLEHTLNRWEVYLQTDTALTPAAMQRQARELWARHIGTPVPGARKTA